MIKILLSVFLIISFFNENNVKSYNLKKIYKSFNFIINKNINFSNESFLNNNNKKKIQHNVIYNVDVNKQNGKYEIKSKALKKIYERKLINYLSDLKNIDKILYENEKETDESKKKSVYIGFDLSCKYLHIGNLIPLITLNILRNYNTNVIVILGRSTTKIGDPSFEIKERKKKGNEEIYDNEINIRNTIITFFLQNEMNQNDLKELIKKNNIENTEFYYNSNNKGSLRILSNIWYDKINFIDFLKYGEYFSINKLLRKECFLMKKENLTLKDLNYVTLQSYDFIYLFQKYNTYIQIGGSDQWGNIQSGIELCQNVFNIQLFGLTTNLLKDKNNVKYSKSFYEKNKLPIWIDKKNPPYFFWNFLRNIDDNKINDYIYMLTDLNININNDIEMNNAKKKFSRLCYRLYIWI